jgi:hypothetical protein
MAGFCGTVLLESAFSSTTVFLSHNPKIGIGISVKNIFVLLDIVSWSVCLWQDISDQFIFESKA